MVDELETAGEIEVLPPGLEEGPPGLSMLAAMQDEGPAGMLAAMFAADAPGMLESGQLRGMVVDLVSMLLAAFSGPLWDKAMEEVIEAVSVVGAAHDQEVAAG